MNSFIINMISIIRKYTNTVFFIFLVSFFSHSPLQAATMVIDNGFESGNLRGLLCGGNCPKIATSPTGSGKYSGNFELTRSMSTPYRTEAQIDGDKGKFQFGQEYWLSFKYRYEDWSKDSSGEIAPFQTHTSPSSWTASCGTGPAVGSAPFLMMSVNDEARFVVYKGKILWRGAVQKKQWLNITVHFKISTGGDGYIEVWKDGNKVGRVDGANSPKLDGCGKPLRPPFFKMGVYKWDWRSGRPATQSSRRQLYIDGLKIAQGSSAYSMVSGSSSSLMTNNGFVSSDTSIGSVTEENLVAHWPMTIGSETTTPDESGNGYTAKLANGAQMTGDKSIQFDGIDDYADLGKPQLSGKAMTLSAWIWPNDLENCHPKRGCSLVSKATAYGVQAHDLQLSVVKKGSKKRLRFRLNIDGATTTLTAKSGDSIEQGQWIHAAAVFDGNKMRLYQNGGLVGSKTEKGSVTLRNTSSIRLGGHSVDASSYPWSGKIGDVRLYKYALTPEEIAEQAN